MLRYITLQPRVHSCSRARTVSEQSEDKVLNEEEKRRYQVITEAVMYLAQVTRYGHLKAREISYGGGQAPDSLLGQVHRLLHHLQAGRP